MSGKVIILGAKGRIGRAATKAFAEAGWQVSAFARSWSDKVGSGAVELVSGNAFDADALVKATRGFDVIINALNPPYPRWKDDMPRLTASVIQAAKANSASVIIPGNVYNYGEDMPEKLLEQTPHAPTTRKGRLRFEMEQAFELAAKDGVQTIILRAGDFIEREKTGNWFDSHITSKISKGSLMYPGPLDQMHAWAYLPDLARAMVGLADRRVSLARYEQFGFAGYSLTGHTLVKSLEELAGRKLTVKGMPWKLVKLLGLFMPQMREVAEMEYLWRTPHAIDGTKLADVLPDFVPTRLKVALSDATGDLTSVSTSDRGSVQMKIPTAQEN
jgi:nucleoside-diphosphate-sugar epimerase